MRMFSMSMRTIVCNNEANLQSPLGGPDRAQYVRHWDSNVEVVPDPCEDVVAISIVATSVNVDRNIA